MKIGVIVDNELNTDIRVLREIGILKTHGYEIFVLCFGFDNKLYSHINGIKITRIYIRKKLKDILFFILNSIPVYEWFWSLRIRKFIKSNGIDVLHVHDLYMARAAHVGIRKVKKLMPLILDLHENYPYAVTTYNWTKGFFRSLIARPEEWKAKEKRYLGYAYKIIVLSNDFRDLLIDRHNELSAGDFIVLPNVPDISNLATTNSAAIKSPFKQDFPVILYYGVIAERRGVFDALKVFSTLVRENHEVNLLLIGPVDKKDNLRFHNEITIDLLTDRVKHIPWIDSNELPDYLKICDICIAPFHKNPQHESGVANKIFEYMLGGKPLIVSNCLPQQNLVEKHKCGLVYNNSEEFHDSLIKLISDSDLRKIMGENGYHAITEEYNMDVIKGNLLQLYESIINEK